MRVIDEFIAPWALPGETVPMYVVWEDELEKKDLEIKVTMPKGFLIENLLNVSDAKIQRNKVWIRRLITSGYCGLMFSSKRKYKDLLTKEKIDIEFLLGDKRIYHHDLILNVVRPRLGLIEAPKNVTLTDESDIGNLLNLKLKHSGSGIVHIDIDVSAKGQLVSSHEDLIRIALRKMIKEGFITKEDMEEELQPKKRGIKDVRVEVSRAWVEKLAREVEEILEKRDDVFYELGEEEFIELKELIRKKGVDKFMSALISNVQTFLLDTLLQMFQKYPSDRAVLVSGQTKTFVDSSIKEIKVKIRYKDSLDNEYIPIEVNIGVDDRREKYKSFLIPINLEIQNDWLKGLD